MQGWIITEHFDEVTGEPYKRYEAEPGSEAEEFLKKLESKNLSDYVVRPRRT